jgi:hypothetical protein
MKITTLIKKLFILALLSNNVFLLRLNSENSNTIKNEYKNKNKNENENKFLTKTFSKEKEESGIAGQIYLKGTLEKHKKTQLSVTNLSSIKKEEIKLNSKAKAKSSTNQSEDKNSQPTGNTTENFNSPILAELWVKYFRYTKSNINIKTPRNFFVNSGYYQQTRLYPNLDYSKDKDLIKDKNYFYLSIFKNSLVFNSSKKVN